MTQKSKSIGLCLFSAFLLCGCQGNGGATSSSGKAVTFYPLPGAPSSFTADVPNKGTLESFTYETEAYALESANNVTGLKATKKMNVYLPYGYDPASSYNIVYLMHGGGESEEYWLGTSQWSPTTKAVLDNMIYNKKCDPTIFVTSSYVTSVSGYETDSNFDWIGSYGKELRNVILPTVESRYATYAKKDTSLSNLQASRTHRAFAGFSMGSYTTIKVGMMECLDLFADYGAYSGSLVKEPDFKAALATDAFKNLPIHYMYNGNGSTDIAHDEHKEFCEEIVADMSDRFQDGKNFTWLELKGGSHSYASWIVDLYNSMLVFFKDGFGL